MAFDPYERRIEKLTPEQFARRRVELAALLHEDSKKHPHTPSTEPLRQAGILRSWLSNGTVNLLPADIDLVLAALGAPINEPVDPLEGPRDRAERRSYLLNLEGQLMVERDRLLRH